MKLFDDFERIDESKKKCNESIFDFLNRSAIPWYKFRRNFMEACFSRFPDTQKEQLKKSLQFEKDHRKHLSKFFELLLHELFVKLGCQVEIEKKIPGTELTPDFFITAPGGEKFYVEALTITGESNENKTDNINIQDFFSKLKGIKPKGFDIIAYYNGGLNKTVSCKQLINDLNRWTKELSRSEEIFEEIKTLSKFNGILDYPNKRIAIDYIYPFEYKSENFAVKFFPIPKENRDEIGNLRKRYTFETDQRGDISFEEVPFPQIVQDKIADKIKDYKEKINQPYIIALNINTSVYDLDFNELFYGQECCVVKVKDDGPDFNFTRLENGIFHKEKAKCLNGVLFFNEYGNGLENFESKFFSNNNSYPEIFNIWKNYTIKAREDGLEIIPVTKEKGGLAY